MDLSNINIGDIVQFVVRVENSSTGQDIQHVYLKVTEVNANYIRGLNAIRTLENSDLSYRTYNVNKIIQDTLWKKL